MVLKRLHMGTMAYGVESMDDIREHVANAFSTRGHEGSFRMKRTRDITARIRDIVLALALCHNVSELPVMVGLPCR